MIDPEPDGVPHVDDLEGTGLDLSPSEGMRLRDPMVDGSVEIELSGAEALVLYEWLRRFNGNTEAEFEDPAEQRVLWDLELGLEQQLLPPLRAEYLAALKKARSDVRGENA